MPKNKKKAEAKAKAKAIKLRLDDPQGIGGEGEFEVKMDQTLSDLADIIREDDDDFIWSLWGLLEWMYFTTVEGKLIPMKVTVAKLIQDGLISDGQKLLVECPEDPPVRAALCRPGLLQRSA
jgi:hypothetical protein